MRFRYLELPTASYNGQFGRWPVYELSCMQNKLLAFLYIGRPVFELSGIQNKLLAILCTDVRGRGLTVQEWVTNQHYTIPSDSWDSK